MKCFASDNYSGIHPDILKAIVIGHFIKKQITNIYSDGIFSIGIPRA